MNKLAKKLVASFLCITLILVATLPNCKEAKAFAFPTVSSPVPLTTVDDITVYNQYKADKYQLSGSGCMIPIVLNEDSKMVFSVTNSSAMYTVAGDPKSKSTAETVSIQLYRDGINPVNGSYTCVGGVNSTNAQSVINYLDKGTYYLCIKTTSEGHVLSGSVDVGAMVEKGTSEELYRPSYFEKPNEVKLDTTYKGFLGTTNNKDWYKVTIPVKSLVTFKYRQQATTGCNFELYDKKQELLYSTGFEGSFKWSNTSRYLEPGDYYFALQSGTGGGNTEVNVIYMEYYLNLTKSTSKKTNKNVKVNAATNCTVSDLRFIDKEVTNTNLSNDSYWTVADASNIITANKSFIADHNGIYSVRVTDAQGIQFMNNIKIDNIDKKKPKKPSVKTYKKDTKEIKGTGEKSAKVYVKIGKKTYSGKVGSSKKYTVKTPKLKKGSKISVWQKDSAGNKSKTKTVTVK